MQRFYTSVSVEHGKAGFAVHLDGKPVRTPAKVELALPTRPLADAVAEEWAAQGEQVRASDMHLTQLAATAIDRTPPARDKVVDTIAGYAETDLLCYRAEGPSELTRRQHAAWQPLLDWAAMTYDAPLAVTSGIVPKPQPADALAALRAAVAAYDDLHLTALHQATALTGSVVLGLALLAGRLDAAAAFEAAELDASYQIEHWGEDAEAASRRGAVRRELEAVERFVRLLDA